MLAERQRRLPAEAVELIRDAGLIEAVDLLMVNGAGLSLKNPIQRAAPDLRAATMHAGLMLDSCLEIHGRMLAGKGPHTPAY